MAFIDSRERESGKTRTACHYSLNSLLTKVISVAFLGGSGFDNYDAAYYYMASNSPALALIHTNKKHRKVLSNTYLTFAQKDCKVVTSIEQLMLGIDQPMSLKANLTLKPILTSKEFVSMMAKPWFITASGATIYPSIALNSSIGDDALMFQVYDKDVQRTIAVFACKEIILNSEYSMIKITSSAINAVVLTDFNRYIEGVPYWVFEGTTEMPNMYANPRIRNIREDSPLSRSEGIILNQVMSYIKPQLHMLSESCLLVPTKELGDTDLLSCLGQYITYTDHGGGDYYVISEQYRQLLTDNNISFLTTNPSQMITASIVESLTNSDNPSKELMNLCDVPSHVVGLYDTLRSVANNEKFDYFDLKVSSDMYTYIDENFTTRQITQSPYCIAFNYRGLGFFDSLGPLTMARKGEAASQKALSSTLLSALYASENSHVILNYPRDTNGNDPLLTLDLERMTTGKYDPDYLPKTEDKILQSIRFTSRKWRMRSEELEIARTQDLGCVVWLPMAITGYNDFIFRYQASVFVDMTNTDKTLKDYV